MLAWRAGPQADLSRLAVSVDLRAISVVEGVRAAFAIVAVVGLGVLVGIPGLTEAALGALLTCLGDSGGPVRRRVPPMVAFALIGGVLTAGFGLLRPFGLGVVVPVAVVVVAAAGFARIWGQAAGLVGNLLIVVAVLALDRLETPGVALLTGGLFAAGSLWAMVLTVVLWRVHPYRPARRALAEVFRRLGALVAAYAPLLAAGGAADWEGHARGHRRHVREAIEAARAQVLDTVRIRGGGSVRANQSVIQLEAADQVFGVVIALADALEQGDGEARAAAVRALPALRLLFAALADATGRDQARDDPAEQAMVGRLVDAVARLEAVPALAGLAGSLLDRLRIALLLTTPEGLLPGRERGVPERGRWVDAVMAPVRANLRWDSAVLRHAVRVAVVAGPALAVTLAVGDTYAHWLTITLVVTLQPFFAATWQRALERCGGTMLGGIAAAGIAAVVHGALGTLAVLAPLTVVALAVRPVSYGLFIAILTPMIVLLSELGQPGESEFVIAAWRAGYTVLGGLLAVGAGAVLWPSWEPARVRAAIRAAIVAHAAYADQQLAAIAGVGGELEAGVEAARRAAGLSTNNLEATVSRALQEPRSAGRDESEVALIVDAALRRLAGRLLVLQHDPVRAGDGARVEVWRAWVAAAFAAVAEGRALPAGGAPEPEHPTFGRIARQLGLIAGALAPEMRRGDGR